MRRGKAAPLNIQYHVQGEFQDTSSERTSGDKDAGLYAKNERVIVTPQSSDIEVAGTKGRGAQFLRQQLSRRYGNSRLIGLRRRPWTVAATACRRCASSAAPRISHKELEKAISDYFKTEDTILYAACFDANGGLFEASLHRTGCHHQRRPSTMPPSSTACASAKAKRFRYNNADMEDLGAASRKRRTATIASSPPTVCSRWTVTWLLWTKYANSPRNTTRS